MDCSDQVWLELPLLGILQVVELRFKLYTPPALPVGAGMPYGIHTPMQSQLALTLCPQGPASSGAGERCQELLQCLRELI